MKQQLLLLEDVDSLGKKGEIVSARPGYIRNYLIPKGFAIIASKNTLRKQEKLRAERDQQALVDRKEAEEWAAKIEGISLEIRVKVDPDGHMYGSVSANDVARLFQERGFSIDRRNILLPRPLKEIGSHPLSLRLKEGVPASFTLQILPEGASDLSGIEAVTAPLSPEVSTANEEEQNQP